VGARTHGNWWKWNNWRISQTRLLAAMYRLWAHIWHICTGCQGSDSGG